MAYLKSILIALSLLSVSLGLPQQQQVSVESLPLLLDTFDNPNRNALGYW